MYGEEGRWKRMLQEAWTGKSETAGEGASSLV